MCSGLRFSKPGKQVNGCSITDNQTNYKWVEKKADFRKAGFIYRFASKNWRKRITSPGNSLAVQWSGLCASTAGGKSLIPVPGTKIPQAAQHGQTKQNTKQKE